MPLRVVPSSTGLPSKRRPGIGILSIADQEIGVFRHPKLGTDLPVSVSGCLETSLFFKTPFQGQISVPTSFVSLFIFYIFPSLLSKTMGCFSGCLMSSAGIQKLFCGIYSAFKCSFDEFMGEKVVSSSYSSTILGLPPLILF